MFLKEIKEQCLFAEDKHENENYQMDKETVDEFNKETFIKSTNLAELSKDVCSIEKIINTKNVNDVNKLFRLPSWVLRFITNLKKKCQNEKLNLDYLFDAQKLIKLIYCGLYIVNNSRNAGRGAEFY